MFAADIHNTIRSDKKKILCDSGDDDDSPIVSIQAVCIQHVTIEPHHIHA